MISQFASHIGAAGAALFSPSGDCRLDMDMDMVNVNGYDTCFPMHSHSMEILKLTCGYILFI